MSCTSARHPRVAFVPGHTHLPSRISIYRTPVALKTLHVRPVEIENGHCLVDFPFVEERADLGRHGIGSCPVHVEFPRGLRLRRLRRRINRHFEKDFLFLRFPADYRRAFIVMGTGRGFGEVGMPGDCGEGFSTGFGMGNDCWVGRSTLTAGASGGAGFRRRFHRPLRERC